MPSETTIEREGDKTRPLPSSPLSEFRVEGMSCANCARHVVEAVQSVAGVQSATASVEQHRASVRWRAGAEPNLEAVVNAVKEAGYSAKALSEDEPGHDHDQLAGWTLNLWIGLLGTVALMLGEWVLQLGNTRWFQWFSFAVATVVQIFAGGRFYRGAWTQLKAGSSNMDTLVALGSTTAFVYSTWALFSHAAGHTYFMEAAAIITVISIGHWMESRVSLRASSALRGLLNLAPAQARKLNPDGTEAEAPVSELQVNDQILLRPGDRVPTDGEVAEGASALDESMLTGESTPVDKSGRDRLYAGTVNINGRLIMRVTATGQETALAHIIEAVQRAQTSRADIQRLGDRVSSVFVPIVVAVALAAGLWWGLAPESAQGVHDWLSHYLWAAHVPAGTLAAPFIIAASVLILACPCAMGLATPVAIMAGSNAAASRGILIRDGVALEKAGQITAVLFDKTGTLTVGKPEVVNVWAESNATPSHDAQSLAAALARHSAHPISQAIARLPGTGPELEEWQEVRGNGVVAHLRENKDEGKMKLTARLGSLRWLEDSDVNLESGREFIQRWTNQGATVVGVSLERTLAGLFAIKDTVKVGAPKVIEQLRKEGLQTFLVTGDNARTASSIASQSGIPSDNVFAEIRPEQKAELVKKLQAQGERVAFVGDGINDAPALEQADLGIAVSRASDIAREAADIILLNSEIEAVPESLGLARATLRTIKQNLFWAFFYNAVGIPLAALGFMSPILCAAAMGLSDLVVIGNALRLRRWR